MKGNDCQILEDNKIDIFVLNSIRVDLLLKPIELDLIQTLHRVLATFL